jgi:hypothetical protein
VIPTPSYVGATRAKPLATIVESSARGLQGPTGNDNTTLRDALLSLATQVRLSGSEWRVLALVLAAGEPVNARELARRLRGPRGFVKIYPHVKAAVRGLVAWELLERGPGGLTFQPDPARWGHQPHEAGGTDAGPPR